MNTGGESQQEVFESVFLNDAIDRWRFHYTSDPLTRFIRDRRMNIAVGYLLKEMGVTLDKLTHWDVLIICGGVGGEGTYFANLGFRAVTNSDFSTNALALCQRFDPRLKTLQLNAENLDLADDSYDLVLVQDGLHHLSRPVVGYLEMLRVARKAVVVIEPHIGLVAKLLGTEWERLEHGVNYVFRWNQSILEQSAKSFLLERPCSIKAHRIWDHNVSIGKLARRFPERMRLFAAKAAYGILTALLPRLGNMMIGVVIKW